MSATVVSEIAEHLDVSVPIRELEKLSAKHEILQPARDLFVELTQWLAGVLLERTQQLRSRWQKECTATLANGSEQLHERRGELLTQFADLCGNLRAVLPLASMAEMLAERGLAGTSQLPGALAELVRLQSSIFDRWVTLEDLEAVLVRHFHIPKEKLEALAKKYPPPPEWFTDDDKPF